MITAEYELKAGWTDLFQSVCITNDKAFINLSVAMWTEHWLFKQDV